MRVGAIILLRLMAAGCTVPKATKIPLIVSANSIAKLRGTHSVLQKRKLASLICRKAGYRKRTAPYYQCMRAQIARVCSKHGRSRTTIFNRPPKNMVSA